MSDNSDGRKEGGKGSEDSGLTSAEHFDYLVGLMPAFVASLYSSREAIEKAQIEGLRRLLHHAKEHSSWHRHRMSDIDPLTATPSDLHRIPTMTKEDLMRNWDDIVTVPGARLSEAEAYLKDFSDFSYFMDHHLLLTSGGSTGMTGVFLYDWHGWAVNRASMSRSMVPLMQQYGRPSTLRTASVSANAPTHYSALMTKSFSASDNPIARFPLSLPVDKIVEGLSDFQPQVLHCFSSYLPVLCQQARRGSLVINPKVIFCTSEPLLEQDWQTARETWNAVVMSCWSASETSGTFPCPARNVFHVSEDVNILEPVDEFGRTIGPGEQSTEVLVTNLYNLAMPLIRYRIEDMFELTDEQCGCKSNYKVVKKVHGRNFEIFSYGDRAAVHPEVLETPILLLPKVIEYQIRQTERGADVYITSEEPIDKIKLAGELRRLLRDLGVPEPIARVKQVDDIERTINGKLKRYIPLRREPSEGGAGASSLAQMERTA